MSNRGHLLLVSCNRIKMENSEEPQKKVFKARKTMRASDRQQLESVYKVKEDLLKTADLKLLNGKHENGDSDISSPLLNSDCIEEREVNGLDDACLDPEDNKIESDEITDVKSPDNKDNQHSDLTAKFETLSPENIVSEQHHENSSPLLSPGSESQVVDCNKDNDIQEEITIKEDLNYKDLCVADISDQKSSSSHTEEESNINDQMVEPAETNELAITPELSIEEKNNAEEAVVKENVDEEAISSSLNTAEGSKNEIKSADVVETIAQKTVEEPPTENMLGNAARMETDEIIPILEKLAPANALDCFSQPILLPVETPSLCSEEKVANSLNSPSKHESNESLPKEAFLVLSDEEEVCCDKDAVVLMPSHENPPEDREEKKELNHIEEKEPNKEEKPPEKCEASRRKRSKSEDMDSIHSKRRRYLGDFEAEFEVKITTKGDVHQKLEKVIHRFLEEKFSAIECALFDKTLENLKSRVDKIECNKRHKTIITELQAKIARLTKRFGAAREDSKKKPETLQNTPHSPGKAVSDTGSVNSVTFRNAGTVRQMLESKRNVGDTSSTTFQSPVNAVPAASLTTPQTPVSGHSKPQIPVTSASLTSGSLTTPVLPTANTATVVGTSQGAGGNTQPMSVSLQSLPVILHVPVAMSSQPQLLQGHTGTLVTNQQSGSVEFIPVQSQSNVGNLTKTPLSLSSTNSAKPNNNPSVSSSSIQRNSPASVGCSIGTTLAVQAVTTAHPVAQAARTTLATVSTSGIYTPPLNRNSIQMKIPISAFNNSAASEMNTTPRIENQTSRLLPPPPAAADNIANKKAEVPSQTGKVTGSIAAGVIDLTLDDEDDGSSQDGKKQNQNQPNNPGMGLSAPSIARPLHPVQTTPLQQAGVPTSGLSQATIHVLPTAQTTVNVTHRPVTQATARLPIPRAPANHQVVYTTLPAPSGQNPVRTTVMQNSGLRQISPQNSGVTVRVPQTTAYVVNSGLTLGSGTPQLTVHHRPPPVHTEPLRPVHPAPLPEAQQPSRLPPEAANHSLPQKPHLKLARVQSQNGIVLSWSVLEVDRSCASVDSYHLYAYHEDPSATVPSQWKKIGEVKALPLPMACTLTQFVSGSKYYFAVRAKDIYGRFGLFCDPQSTDVIASQSS
ncbi:activating transcription factor 7-interacting protein 1 isoform X1 [Notechis scutatus]|uniref:Activating transcription factor 7-interacting protein 1 isoform X1 n=2 Tax=Notechis scutatus TaxID=8663 RepID=A0A6J1W4Z2_9SAUR|nr:activating transcription factor 7-interacting protein 1 isoform X1 [Notechis scutatus]